MKRKTLGRTQHLQINVYEWKLTNRLLFFTQRSIIYKHDNIFMHTDVYEIFDMESCVFMCKYIIYISKYTSDATQRIFSPVSEV